jgi:exosortase
MSDSRKIDVGRLAAGAVLAATFGWAYWPTLVGLVSAWNREPDYSHGYLVVPVALVILWVRREKYPGASSRLAWAGLALVALSVGVRMLGARYYIDAIDGWSIIFWVAGAAWFLGGAPVCRWCLPSILFLWFMVPLPFRVEHAFSRPLQYAATQISCWILQCLGLPAFAENNSLFLNERIDIGAACAGLRIFMGIVAVAFAYMVLVRRAWWEKVLLVVSIVPVAVAANVARVVVTVLMYQGISDSDWRLRVHDWAGYAMIPLALALFALVSWYVGRLVQTVEVADVGDMVRHQRARV